MENINGSNTKEKPTFSDECTGQVQTLKQMALKAVDNSALISRVNRKLTLDCSSEIDTSRDSTLTHSVHSLQSKNSSLFNALMHMDNVVITITDEAKQLIQAASNTERSVAVSSPMPIKILASIDTDSDESIDKDAFMTELMATHEEDSGLCHNRISFSKSFLLDSTCNSFDVQAQLNIDLDLASCSDMEQRQLDAVCLNVVRICEQTIATVQQQQDKMSPCVKRKRPVDDDGDDEQQDRAKKMKPKCGCSVS